MDKVQTLISHLSGKDFSTVRTAYIVRAREEHGRVSATLADMMARGMVEIDVGADAIMTDDGRPIMRFAGRALVHTPEVHAQRLAVALELAQQRDAVIKSQNQAAETSGSPTICTNLIDGQLCGGVLSTTPVCPRCALGKQGVAQIMTCDVCGAQTAVMR